MTNKLVSPKGIAKYPWLNKPDTKFDDLGAYKVDLIVPKDDAKSYLDKIVAIFKEEAGPKAKPVNKPWYDELDDDGNATGNVVFRFKNQLKPNWMERKPVLKGPDPKQVLDVNVGGGSLIRVAGPVYIWQNAKGYGIGLQMEAVQVLDLKTYEPKTQADDFFEVEEGFELEIENNETDLLPEKGKDENLF